MATEKGRYALARGVGGHALRGQGWDAEYGAQPAHLGAPEPPEPEEHFRLRLLAATELLDSQSDPSFDLVVQLMYRILRVPMGAVSLVDGDRQWFKAQVGLGCPETDRNASFCAWGLVPTQPQVIAVPDAAEDARFAQNPLVLGGPGIRMYYGAPIILGYARRVGMLCAIDSVPRELSAEEQAVLVNLAGLVSLEVMQRAPEDVEELPPALPADIRPEQLMSPMWQHLSRVGQGDKTAVLLVERDSQLVLYSNKCFEHLGVPHRVRAHSEPVDQCALGRPTYDVAPLGDFFSAEDAAFVARQAKGKWFTRKLTPRSGGSFWATFCPLDCPLDMAAATLAPAGRPRGEYYLCCAVLPHEREEFDSLPSSEECPFPDVILAAENKGKFLGLVGGRPCTVWRSGPGEPELRRPLRREEHNGLVWTLTEGAEGYEWHALGLSAAARESSPPGAAPPPDELQVLLGRASRALHALPEPDQRRFCDDLGVLLRKYGS